MVDAAVRKLLVAIIGALVASIFVMLLWNALMPAIFSLTKINFWQSAGLLILTNTLFNSQRTTEN